MQRYFVSVDVGGTRTRAGIVSDDLSLLGRQGGREHLQVTAHGVSTTATYDRGLLVFPTPTLRRYPARAVPTLQSVLVSYIVQAVERLQRDLPPGAVLAGGAVAFAGLVKDHAVVTKAADLYFGWGEWEETAHASAAQPPQAFSLKARLERRLPALSWFLVNDVIAATWRYARLPHNRQVHKLALLTISTGVGYAVFDRSAATFGERDLVSLGHRVVDGSDEARACDCGGRGHLAAYFSGKAVENRVRERASQEPLAFVQSSLCHALREQVARMSPAEKKERLQSAAVRALIRTHASPPTEGEMRAFLQHAPLALEEGRDPSHDAFLLAMMVKNREIAQAARGRDGFVLACLDQMVAMVVPGFLELLERGPQKIVIMGGFVLAIRDVFLELLLAHLGKAAAHSEALATLQERIDWALDDDLDGVIGAVCAKQHVDAQAPCAVTRATDGRGSSVFEMQVHTQTHSARIHTRHVFDLANATLQRLLTDSSGSTARVMVVTDECLPPTEVQRMRSYFTARAIPFHHYPLASGRAPHMEDVEALLLAAKVFKLGRTDWFLTVGGTATLHCGGLAAGIYRRGVPHIFLPLNDSDEGLATARHKVNMFSEEERGAVSHHHPPAAIVLDGALLQRSPQEPPALEAIPQTVRYSVMFVNQLFDQSNTSLSSLVEGNHALVVISEAADMLYGERIQRYLGAHEIAYRYAVYDGGERHKYFPQVLDLVRQILLGRDPDERLICIGGGVTMDLAGFAAALTGRQYLRIPTTLLGIIDAGIGVKVGCNFRGAKNFLGDFYPPLACLNDVTFLNTVTARNMRAGLAEILKMGIVREPKIVKIVEEHHNRLIPERFQKGNYARDLLELATVWMLRELQGNLYEHNTLKRLVDFGHAFSPFLEIASGHRILHGEAVAIDMALCTALSHLRGLCSLETRERIVNVLLAVGLPIFDGVCEAEGLAQGLNDIRLARGGSLHLPVPREVGTMLFLEDVTEQEIAQAVTYLQAKSAGALVARRREEQR